MTLKGIGYLVKMIDDKMKVKADADLTHYDLTLSQCRVLTFLQSQEGQATQKEIEDFLEVSHPTVVGLVSRMERRGYVITWLDTKQQRSKMVRLTEKAQTVAEELVHMVQEQEASMVRGLTQEQVAELTRMLLVIYKNLE
ncbi:MarR family winged helix-turn-helix transcriptional regulator [Pseudoflavonifractor sp.]|jgi:DNA-binding MarR family transcriptional regulator|uniref:MarR family winged helix-turn-helix transcriptional regulator n=1 Tax=Pseudoflavonifractor sp. TaxID=1980281 RepID=UPI003D90583E